MSQQLKVSFLVDEEKLVISVYPTIFYFILLSTHPKLLDRETEAWSQRSDAKSTTSLYTLQSKTKCNYWNPALILDEKIA